MTAPRWIAEALAVADPADDDVIAAALLERLPIEAMRLALDRWTDRHTALARIVAALTEGDPEVMQLAELYQGASKALDEAGVPYAIEGCALMDMQRRIRWLAQQRPTRLELQRVEAERDSKASQLEELSKMFTGLSKERDRLVADLESALNRSAGYIKRMTDLEAERAGLVKLAADRSEELARVTIQCRDAQNREAELRDRFKVIQAERDTDREAYAQGIADASIERDRLATERDRVKADADQLSASAVDDYVRLLADYEGFKNQLAKANELNGKLAADGAAAEAERDEYKRQRDAAEDAIAGLRQQSTTQAARIKELSTRVVTKPRGKLPAKLRPRGKTSVRR